MKEDAIKKGALKVKEKEKMKSEEIEEVKMMDRDANLKKVPGALRVPSPPVGGASSSSNAKSSIGAMEQVAQQEYYEKQDQLQKEEEDIAVEKKGLEAVEAAIEKAMEYERQALAAWTLAHRAANALQQ